MRILTVAVSVVFLLLISALATAAVGGENSGPLVRLEFSAVPEKQEYHVGDVVRLSFTLHNSGDQDVLVARHFVLREYVWVLVSGPERKELPWCGKIDGRAYAPDEFAILRPGATIRDKVRVSCDAHRDSGFVLDRAGTYTLSSYYYLPQPARSLRRIAGGVAVTKDRIRAEPVSITLRFPAGAER